MRRPRSSDSRSTASYDSDRSVDSATTFESLSPSASPPPSPMAGRIASFVPRLARRRATSASSVASTVSTAGTSPKRKTAYGLFRRIPLSTVLLFLLLLQAKYQESRMIFLHNECSCSCPELASSQRTSDASSSVTVGTAVESLVLRPADLLPNGTAVNRASPQTDAHRQQQAGTDAQPPTRQTPAQPSQSKADDEEEDTPRIRTLRSVIVREFLRLERQIKIAELSNNSSSSGGRTNTEILSSPMLRDTLRNNETVDDLLQQYKLSLSTNSSSNSNSTNNNKTKTRTAKNNSTNNNNNNNKTAKNKKRSSAVAANPLVLDPYGFYVSKSLPNIYVANRPHRTADGRTQPNDGTPGTQPEDRVVMLTHVSADKLERLQVQLDWWNGPASVAVYVQNVRDIEALANFWSEHYRDEYVLRSTPQNGTRLGDPISFHIYMEVTPWEEPQSEKQPQSSTVDDVHRKSLHSNETQQHPNVTVSTPVRTKRRRRVLPYAHNHLRQLAMEPIANNTFFLAMDVDFVTSWNCHDELQRLLALPTHTEKNNGHATSIRHELVNNNRVFVLPAFNEEKRSSQSKFVQDNDDSYLPKTRQELKDKVNRGEMDMFRKKKFPAGHASTDFPRWLSWNDPRDDNTSRNNAGSVRGAAPADAQQLFAEDHWYPIEYAEGFEPYVLGYYTKPVQSDASSPTKDNAVAVTDASSPTPQANPKPTIPSYRTEFRGYGKNKLSWIMELYRSGYSFGVLQTPWVVHMYHPVGDAKNRRYELDYNKKILYPKFLKLMDEIYGPEKKSNGIVTDTDSKKAS